jgi:hypothetical protein
MTRTPAAGPVAAHSTMATADAAASVTTVTAPSTSRPGLTPRSTIAAIPGKP